MRPRPKCVAEQLPCTLCCGQLGQHTQGWRIPPDAHPHRYRVMVWCAAVGAWPTTRMCRNAGVRRAAKRARSRKAGSTQEEAQGQDPATPTRAARAETNNEDATTPMETSSTPGVLPHLSPTEPSSAGKARGEEATTAGGSEAGPSTAEHVADGTAEIRDSELVTAVHMAVASSYLSYPYTLAHTIASNASCAEVVAQAAAAGRAVVVTMLGASETAELAHMSCWQVGGAPRGW